jgi:hypothetical protein
MKTQDDADFFAAESLGFIGGFTDIAVMYRARELIPIPPLMGVCLEV